MSYYKDIKQTTKFNSEGSVDKKYKTKIVHKNGEKGNKIRMSY